MPSIKDVFRGVTHRSADGSWDAPPKKAVPALHPDWHHQRHGEQSSRRVVKRQG